MHASRFSRRDLRTWERTGADMEALCKQMLTALGEDPEREGLLRTPHRMASAYEFLTRGYDEDAGAIIRSALFEEKSEDIVICRDIEFYSMCEHHFLPFFGRAHIAYIPEGKIIGISKLARVVEVFSRRLQVQERLTHQVAQCLLENLKPQGVAVIMEANHLCMMMRGVEKQGAATITSAMYGSFRHNPSTRAEFLSLLKRTGA